jgi:hypothetical protein
VNGRFLSLRNEENEGSEERIIYPLALHPSLSSRLRDKKAFNFDSFDVEDENRPDRFSL